MTRKITLSRFQFAIAVILSWLGLAGFADNFVEWVEWFDVGFMDHWRAVKRWIEVNVLFWVPWSLPKFTIDYLVFGFAYARGFALAQSNLLYEASLERENEHEAHLTFAYILQLFRVLLTSAPLVVLVWPIFFLIILALSISTNLKSIKSSEHYLPEQLVDELIREKKYADSQISLFVWSIVLFLPALFLVSDALYLLADKGWLTMP